MIKIEEQGECILSNNQYNIIYENTDIAILEIDMKTKHGDIAYMSNSEDEDNLIIYSNEDSIHLNIDSNKDTIISFPNYPKWKIYLAEYVRYTLRCVLLKRDS